jgi:membrane protease YdiL (CAAX protease family)
VNWWFFLTFAPVAAGLLAVASILRKPDPGHWYRWARIGLVLFALWLTRLFLILFEMGRYPALVMDPAFYAVAFGVGTVFLLIYLLVVEGTSPKAVGWVLPRETAGKTLVAGVLGAILILGVSAACYAPTVGINLAPEVTAPKVWTAIFFGLGAIYEEWFFRGRLYQVLKTRYSVGTANALQALAFAAIHVGYLSTAFWALDYWLILLLGVITGWLAERHGLVASALCHGLFVFVGALTI